jgi:hypothetical protein
MPDPTPLPPTREPSASSGEVPVRTATFLQTARAVLWSFFGVRRRREFEKDVRLNPVHVVIMGLIAGAIFVLTLVGLVSLIVGNV